MAGLVSSICMKGFSQFQLFSVLLTLFMRVNVNTNSYKYVWLESASSNKYNIWFQLKFNFERNAKEKLVKDIYAY